MLFVFPLSRPNCRRRVCRATQKQVDSILRSPPSLQSPARTPGKEKKKTFFSIAGSSRGCKWWTDKWGREYSRHQSRAAAPSTYARSAIACFFPTARSMWADLELSSLHYVRPCIRWWWRASEAGPGTSLRMHTKKRCFLLPPPAAAREIACC